MVNYNYREGDWSVYTILGGGCVRQGCPIPATRSNQSVPISIVKPYRERSMSSSLAKVVWDGRLSSIAISGTMWAFFGPKGCGCLGHTHFDKRPMSDLDAFNRHNRLQTLRLFTKTGWFFCAVDVVFWFGIIIFVLLDGFNDRTHYHLDSACFGISLVCKRKFRLNRQRL